MFNFPSEFHEPCSGLSLQKVAEKGAEPLDPKEFVKDWVTKVDTVNSGMQDWRYSEPLDDNASFGHPQYFV